MTTEITEKTNQTPAELVKQELQKANITVELLAALQKKKELKLDAFISDTGELVVNKEQLKEVRTARLEVKTTRIAIEKTCKSLRDVANDYVKENRKAELHLLGILEPVETYLQTEEDKVPALEAELSARDNQKASQLLTARVEILQKVKLNAVFGEQFVQVGSTTIACLDLKHNSEDWFQQVLTTVKAEAAAEAEKKASEAAALKEVERAAEAVKALQEEESKRLEAIRLEQEAKQKELDAKYEELAAIERKIEEEKAAAAEAVRLEEQKKELAASALVKAKQDLEAKKQQEEEAAQKKAEAAAKRDARKPDTAKLLALAEVIRQLPSPDLKSQEAFAILFDAQKGLEEVANLICNKVAELQK